MANTAANVLLGMARRRNPDGTLGGYESIFPNVVAPLSESEQLVLETMAMMQMKIDMLQMQLDEKNTIEGGN